MICLTCTRKTNCAIWLSEAEARIHTDTHPTHEIGDQEPEERMTSDERASKFQRVYFGGKPIKVVETKPWYLNPRWWILIITISMTVVYWWLAVEFIVGFWK